MVPGGVATSRSSTARRIYTTRIRTLKAPTCVPTLAWSPTGRTLPTTTESGWARGGCIRECCSCSASSKGESTRTRRTAPNRTHAMARRCPSRACAAEQELRLEGRSQDGDSTPSVDTADARWRTPRRRVGIDNVDLPVRTVAQDVQLTVVQPEQLTKAQKV